MAHVAGAGRLLQRLEVDADETGDPLPQLANARGDAVPDVEHRAVRLFGRRVTGKQVRLDDVREEREVARVPAVAEDDGGRAVQCGGDKQGDNGAVVRLEALAWSENVEVAQYHRFEPVGPPEGLAIRLPREFGGRVRREGARQERLVIGELGGVPV